MFPKEYQVPLNRAKDRDQPACGIKLLTLPDGVDHEQDRDQFQRKNERGKDGICNLNRDRRQC